MQEWNKKNEFNSFNSWKGLLYSDWYKAIIEWRDGERFAPLPPIEASLDPIHACNLHCEHCNAASYLISDLKDRRMTDDHLMNLVQFLCEWGVKAICFGGGGEPTLHTKLADALWKCKENGVSASIATNGTMLASHPKLLVAAAECCRWVGISVDSATAETYAIGRNKDTFQQTIDGIKALVDVTKETGGQCEVSYKFLVFDYNQHEIYDACKLAKELGVRDFHARPADFSHQGMGDLKKSQNPYDLDIIMEQFERCHELEDDNFRVFTVVHKFNPDFTPTKNFEFCYATPIVIQLCADSHTYFCVDQRHKPQYSLGTHFPDPRNILNFWGSDRHKEIVFGNTAKICTTRCTFGTYCKQVEELFAKNSNPMCWEFT